MDLNKVILIGNLTRDPVSKETTGGKVVTKFTLATSQKIKDKEYSQFHNIVGWQKLGTNMAKMLAKGNKVYIEGQLRNDAYTAKDGTKKYYTQIVASNMIILKGSKKVEVETDPAKIQIEEADVAPF